MTNILKDFDIIWKSVKKTKSSDAENQLKIRMHQHCFYQQEGSQSNLDSLQSPMNFYTLLEYF